MAAKLLKGDEFNGDAHSPAFFIFYKQNNNKNVKKAGKVSDVCNNIVINDKFLDPLVLLNPNSFK